MEKRFTSEVRAKGRRVSGYAATFGTETVYAGVRERIMPGAFTRTLSEDRDILCLCDHDTTRVLGRTRSGSLTLMEDGTGLAYDLALPATRVGLDIQELASRGDIGGMSFGFHVLRETFEADVREIREVELHEISIVQAHPAYSNTSVNLRHKAETPLLNTRRRTLTLWG